MEENLFWPIKYVVEFKTTSEAKSWTHNQAPKVSIFPFFFDKPFIHCPKLHKNILKRLQKRQIKALKNLKLK